MGCCFQHVPERRRRETMVLRWAGAAIKWPEVNRETHTNFGDDGLSPQISNTYSASAPSRNPSTFDTTEHMDPYAVPPVPQFNPNQPYRDDLHASSNTEYSMKDRSMDTRIPLWVLTLLVHGALIIHVSEHQCCCHFWDVFVIMQLWYDLRATIHGPRGPNHILWTTAAVILALRLLIIALVSWQPDDIFQLLAAPYVSLLAFSLSAQQVSASWP